MDRAETEVCNAFITLFRRTLASEPHRKASVAGSPVPFLIAYVSLRLQSRIRTLTHHEVRELRHMIDEVQGYDVVANLPLEIAAVILQYLPPHQAFQARRVSRAWHRVLSSTLVTDTLLSFWDSGTNPQLSIPQGSSAAEVAALKAEHIHAFTAARPCSSRMYQPFSMSYHSQHNEISYSSGIVAWIEPDNRRVCRTLDFRTGEWASCTTPERCTLNHIGVSTTLVAATSQLGTCFVWTRDQKCMSFSIPSARVDGLVLSNETIAISFAPEFHSTGGGKVTVLIWQFPSQKSRSFFLELQIVHFQCTIETMLDKKGESFILFEHAGDSTSSPFHQFCSTRLHLGDETMVQSSLRCDRPPDQWLRSDWTPPMQAKTLTSIWSSFQYRKDSSGFYPPPEVRRICYDFRDDRLRLELQHVKPPPEGGEFLDGTCLDFWEDIAFYWTFSDYEENANLRGVIYVLDLRTSAWTKVIMPEPDGWPRGPHTHMFFGDGLFQVQVHRNNIWVLCFDKNIELKGQVKDPIRPDS